MKRKLQFSLGIFLLFTSFKLEARSAADVIFYHYRTSLDDQKVDQLSLLPQEKAIKNFPKPVSENETDLAVLQMYYKDVAQAYERHIKKDIEPKLSEYKEKISRQRENIHLTQTRSPSGKGQFSRSLRDGREKTKGENRPEQIARIKAISYYSTRIKRLSDAVASLKKKANFYQELSETSEELYRGEIH